MMMKTLLLFVAFGVITSLAQAQKASEALQKMIATERAFAQMSLDKGTKMAFSTFFAPSGVTFQNNLPTNGQLHWQKQPEDKGKLQWKPLFANIALAGDLGFTTGPWAYFTRRTDASPNATGSFVTIWKKQPDGSWKVALDLGVGHSALPETAFMPATKLGGKPISQDTSLIKAALMSADYLFSKAIQNDDVLKVYESYLSNDVRLYRYGSQPIMKKNEALKILIKPSQKIKFEPLGGGVSAQGDLGYVYGSASVGDKAGNYLRVWRRAGKREWEIILDLATLPVE